MPEWNWGELFLRELPKALLTWAGILVCVAFAVLIAATIDSTYRTHKPFKVAGYVFGYGADDPTDVEKLKNSINDQFSALAVGAYRDRDAIISNASGANGAGNQYDLQGGKCPDGEMIVGMQPLASREGSSLRYQCGKLPVLHVK